MNLHNLFRFSGVILGLGGLVWLLAPQSMAGAVGYAIDSYDAYLIRALGANNIAWAVLAFLVSGLAHSPARQAVATSFFVLMVVSLFVNLLSALISIVNPGVAWFGVATNVVFALAFGYFSFIRQEESPAPELQP